MHSTRVNALFQPCLAGAKIGGYVWHSNRHTFCSWLAMVGASIKEIQEAAGHKTITMSARYSHLLKMTAGYGVPFC
jgi:site-specific recombinase XerD